MKTKQEQIEAMHKVFCNACKHKLSKDCVCPWQDRAEKCYNCETFCEIFYKAGYDDVSEYKAEIERLRQEVRDTDKMARNSIEQYKNNYDNAFERLKAQEREIQSLREDNIDLKEELYELHDDLDIARAKKDKTINQAKIEVLNKVKEKLDNAPNGWAYTTYIDELIEEVENENNSKTNIPRFI